MTYEWKHIQKMPVVYMSTKDMALFRFASVVMNIYVALLLSFLCPSLLSLLILSTLLLTARPIVSLIAFH